jgi:hypothetical protein
MDSVEFAEFLGVHAPPLSLSPLRSLSPLGMLEQLEDQEINNTEAIMMLEQLDYQEITNNQAEELPTRSGGKSHSCRGEYNCANCMEWLQPDDNGDFWIYHTQRPQRAANYLNALALAAGSPERATVAPKPTKALREPKRPPRSQMDTQGNLVRACLSVATDRLYYL